MTQVEFTSDVLRSAAFREKIKGYNPEDVHALMERAATAIDQLTARLAEASARALKAETALVNNADADESVRRTLVLAQRTAEMAVREANDEAAAVRADAHREADALMAEARERATQLDGEARGRAQAMVMEADRARRDADAHASTMVSESDAYAERVRSDADAYAAKVTAEADAHAAAALADAQARAEARVATAEAAASNIEKAVADELQARRAAVEEEVAAAEAAARAEADEAIASLTDQHRQLWGDVEALTTYLAEERARVLEGLQGSLERFGDLLSPAPRPEIAPPAPAPEPAPLQSPSPSRSPEPAPLALVPAPFAPVIEPEPVPAASFETEAPAYDPAGTAAPVPVVAETTAATAWEEPHASGNGDSADQAGQRWEEPVWQAPAEPQWDAAPAANDATSDWEWPGRAEPAPGADAAAWFAPMAPPGAWSDPWGQGNREWPAAGERDRSATGAVPGGVGPATGWNGWSDEAPHATSWSEAPAPGSSSRPDDGHEWEQPAPEWSGQPHDGSDWTQDDEARWAQAHGAPWAQGQEPGAWDQGQEAGQWPDHHGDAQWEEPQDDGRSRGWGPGATIWRAPGEASSDGWPTPGATEQHDWPAAPEQGGRAAAEPPSWGQREPGGWGEGWGERRTGHGAGEDAPAETAGGWAQSPAEPSPWGEAGSGSPWGKQPDESPWARRSINTPPNDPWSGIEPVDEGGDSSELDPQAPGGLVFRLRQEAAAPVNGAAEEQQTKRKSLLGRLKG